MSSEDRKKINDKYANLSDSEIQREILYTQKRALDKLERIRSNTSALVWFLIVIPILVVILLILND